MNTTQNVTMMTIKTPADARQLLAQWAAENLTSMSAEVIRSIRERAEREREKAEAR